MAQSTPETTGQGLPRGQESAASIAQQLRGMNFPARKADLEQQAKKNGADEFVLDVIHALPDNEYHSMADVMQAFGEVYEHMGRARTELAAANLARHLSGLNFPARKADLEQQAKKNGADEFLLSIIRALPDTEYQTMADVMKGYGQVYEKVRGEFHVQVPEQSAANIAQHLRGINFPARKADLEQQAKQNNADEIVLHVIQSLPDTEYHTMADVMKAFGQVYESMRGGFRMEESAANIAYHLRGVDFPARKADLKQQAQKNNADQTVLKIIDALPDEEYRNMADVMRAYGRVYEQMRRDQAAGVH